MRGTQDNSLVLQQENHGDENSCTALQRDVDDLIRCLQTRANKLNKKRRTRNDRTYWIIRGCQQVLRSVSTRLLAIEAASVVSYTLYLALQEYIACLDKYSMDAEEERNAVGPRNGLPIEQWKAEGEAQELPRIIRMLSHIVQVHTPDSVCHILSLDGKHLVSLHPLSDKQRHAQALAQTLQSFEQSRLPADSHAASELDRNEHSQELALLPARAINRMQSYAGRPTI